MYSLDFTHRNCQLFLDKAEKILRNRNKITAASALSVTTRGRLQTAKNQFEEARNML